MNFLLIFYTSGFCGLSTWKIVDVTIGGTMVLLLHWCGSCEWWRHIVAKLCGNGRNPDALPIISQNVYKIFQTFNLDSSVCVFINILILLDEFWHWTILEVMMIVLLHLSNFVVRIIHGESNLTVYRRYKVGVENVDFFYALVNISTGSRVYPHKHHVTTI